MWSLVLRRQKESVFTRRGRAPDGGPCCYQCGEPGHFGRQCPQRAPGGEKRAHEDGDEEQTHKRARADDADADAAAPEAAAAHEGEEILDDAAAAPEPTAPEPLAVPKLEPETPAPAPDAAPDTPAPPPPMEDLAPPGTAS